MISIAVRVDQQIDAPEGSCVPGKSLDRLGLEQVVTHGEDEWPIQVRLSGQDGQAVGPLPIRVVEPVHSDLEPVDRIDRLPHLIGLVPDDHIGVGDAGRLEREQRTRQQGYAQQREEWLRLNVIQPAAAAGRKNECL